MDLLIIKKEKCIELMGERGCYEPVYFWFEAIMEILFYLSCFSFLFFLGKYLHSRFVLKHPSSLRLVWWSLIFMVAVFALFVFAIVINIPTV